MSLALHLPRQRHRWLPRRRRRLSRRLRQPVHRPAWRVLPCAQGAGEL